MTAPAVMPLPCRACSGTGKLERNSDYYSNSCCECAGLGDVLFWTCELCAKEHDLRDERPANEASGDDFCCGACLRAEALKAADFAGMAAVMRELQATLRGAVPVTVDAPWHIGVVVGRLDVLAERVEALAKVCGEWAR